MSIDIPGQQNEDAARVRDFRSGETMTTHGATKILVADDDLEILALVARHLSALPAEIVEASDGEEALRLARREKPNLVVLDVMMPGMSGWEVCRAIREDESLGQTGVIMLTGIGERLNEMTSPLYGADGFLDKPFELDDLSAKVREVLAGRDSS
ncbi:MAG TPA: response regulator [Polyangiales bacterium]|nr:response regulator [Polyangiales bacterium]